ncbi:MAG: hypothetical protein FWJ74_04145 [Gemmatimonadota bacterium]|jgi:uncharacterized membrane protein YkvI
MNRFATLLLVLLGSIAASGCEVVEGIFKVGFWAGIIVVLLVVFVVWLIVRLLR